MKSYYTYYLKRITCTFVFTVALGFSCSAAGVYAAKKGSNYGNAKANAEIRVTGTVKDEKNAPIPGVSVQVKGREGSGVSTDASGKYAITVPENSVLVFTIIGYKSQEKTIVKDGTVDVKLEPEASNLDEVVVVAYGTQKKTSLTGAVATITPKQLKERPVTSIQNALQGISPGLTILQRPGDVGQDASANTTVSIRGRSSLAATGGPMYIIDGIPATGQEFASLNPNDISNMSVLKDASSAALYGSRAANGVILVTTRRGDGEKASIELNTSYGWQSATRMPEYMGSVDYANLYNEALRNAGSAPLFTPSQIALYQNGSQPDLYPNTNWYDRVLRKKPPLSDVNLNISAPGKITTTYLGLSYLNQGSLIPGKNQDRFVAKLNTETTVVPKILKASTNFSFINQNFDRKGDLSWTELNRSLPTSVFKQSDGQWGSIDNGVVNAQTAGRNQLRLIEEGGQAWDRDNYFQTAGNITLTPVEGLSINGLASLKYTDGNSWAFNNTLDPINNFLTGAPIASTSRVINDGLEYFRKRRELMLQGTADYQRSFGDHFGKLTIGATQESNIYRESLAGRKNFPNNDLTTIVTGSSNPEDINSDGNGLANRTTSQAWAMRSLFGRFNYSYRDKYLLEVNTRIDYSSRFSPEVREAVFPSFSAGWVISKENFMKNLSVVNNLKIRGSYGSLGNQNVVPVGNYFNLINTGYQYSFEDTPQGGAWVSAIPNRLTTWEKVYMTDIGLDATLFKGKLDITADYYIKDTKGLLFTVPRVSTIGVDNLPFENGSSTRNKGFELVVNHNNKIGRDLQFTIGGNFSIIQNRITRLGINDDDVISGRFIQRVGESIGAFYGYEAQGLFVDAADVSSHAFQSAATRPGDIKYKDQNGDNQITQADRVILGNDVPWFNYGFNLSASFKGFDMNVLTYGVARVKTYFSEEAAYPFFNGANTKVQWSNRWTPENPDPNANFPRVLLTGPGAQNYNFTSSFWLFNGAYFRIRGLTLGYTIPQKISQKIKMSRLRIYGTANNPFTFMADKRLGDYDPESGSGRGAYPGIKTWSVGLNAGF